MSRVYEFRLRYGDRYQMICGSDDQALDYFLWGTTAWIGGAASCAPLEHHNVLEAALANDFVTARAAHGQNSCPSSATSKAAATPKRSNSAANCSASPLAVRASRCCPCPLKTARIREDFQSANVVAKRDLRKL
jgi:hypothetical protein